MLISRKSIDNIVFDFGDTLATLDPPKEVLCLEVLRELGYHHSIDRVIKAYMQVEYFMHQRASSLKNKDDKANFYTSYNNELAMSLKIERDSGQFDQLMQQHFNVKKHWVVYPEVKAVLSSLYHDYDLYILANWDLSLSCICRRNTIEAFFKGIYCSEELGAEKPDPEIFLGFIDKTKITPERSIYVGNEYRADVVGSRHCNFTPILIDRDNIYDGDCDCSHIRSISELIADS